MGVGKNIPKISVVVCTYNRGSLLDRCLESLAAQQVDDSLYEVLIIDNNSSDNTAEIATHWVEKKAGFKLFFEPRQGLSHARNRALLEAAADYIAYIDDDAWAEPHWLASALAIILEKEPDIFGGPSLPPDQTGLPDWFDPNYRYMGNAQTGWMSEGLIPGCNFFIKKSLITSYGGFDSNLGMFGEEIRFHEETVIVNRAYKENKKVYFDRELGVHHAVHDYVANVAYFIFIKYQLIKEKFHLFPRSEFGESAFQENALQELLDYLDEFFNDFACALKKRDKKKYPYPENYIIGHTCELYIPLIVERLEYLKLAAGANVKLPGSNNGPLDLNSISRQVINDKGIMKLFSMIIKGKIKQISEKNIDGTK